MQALAPALVVLALTWNKLLTITLHQELAQVEGLAVGKIRLLLMLLIATVIALSMKVVGILLITSLMIIPPAIARSYSSSPEKMAILASLIGCLAGVWWPTRFVLSRYPQRPKYCC